MNSPGTLRAFCRRCESSLLARTLTIVGVASLTVAATLICLSLMATERRAEAQARQRLDELIDVTGTMAAVACFAQDRVLALETARAFIESSDVLSVAIRTRDGELARATRPGETLPADGEPDALPVTRPIYSPFVPEERIGEIVVVPNWRGFKQELATHVREDGIILALLALGIFCAIAAVVSSVLIRPVMLISNRLHALDAAAGAVLEVPAGHAGNELGRLVGDVNSLMQRLRAALEQEHEVVLAEKLRLAAAVFEHSHEGIIICDEDNRMVAVNRAFSQILGYAEEAVLGENPRMLSSGRHDRAFYAQMWAALLGKGYWRGEIWNRTMDDRVIPLWSSINVVRDAQGKLTNYVAIFSDISERKIAEERIEFLAQHDQLTKLPNMLLLRDRFSQATAAASREGSGITFLFANLDHLKHVNDGLGYAAGDRMLVEMVKRISLCIRDTDTICRHGGDEFIVLLANMYDLSVIVRIVQNILEAVSAPVDLDGQVVSLTASIGISVFPADGDDFQTLLSKADMAMHEVKASGRNGYHFFTDEMNADAADRLQLRAMLRDALANDELLLHYQPQIDLASGTVTGVEALVRWKHPALGMVPPGRFIPLAEEYGFIVPIGEWVLMQACRHACEWRQAGYDHLGVAVNISALQFSRGDIVGTVERVLQESGLPPPLLELELTESALFRDIDGTRETIRMLKNLGVRLSIDDFGTGYSSLAYVKQIKVDKLKIDQSFIRDIQQDADDLAIVRAIVDMGRTLQMRVIAEGIETKQQMEILRSDGCNEGQGFYFARPLPFDGLVAFLRDWRGGRQDLLTPLLPPSA